MEKIEEERLKAVKGITNLFLKYRKDGTKDEKFMKEQDIKK